MAFNQNQIASYDEARALRDYLNGTQQFADNQILPGDDQSLPAPVPDPNFPWLPVKEPLIGIYIPAWSNVPGAGPAPNDGDKLFLHFRMTNPRQGYKGFNVGLISDKFRRFAGSPSAQLSALNHIAGEMV